MSTGSDLADLNVFDRGASIDRGKILGPSSRRASEPEPTHLEAFSCSGIFGGRVMNPDFFRRFAQQCRDLIARARSEPAREQLRIWAKEFDARANALEQGLCDQPDRTVGPPQGEA